jgi:hypothetical protein
MIDVVVRAVIVLGAVGVTTAYTMGRLFHRLWATPDVAEGVGAEARAGSASRALSRRASC